MKPIKEIRDKTNMIKIRTKMMMHYTVSHERINDWLNSITPLFLLGLGRSGTDFFAKLLNKAPNAIVYHEPVKEDYWALVRAHKSKKDASDYVKRFRKKTMYILGKNKGMGIYGEANSNLRYHAEALKSEIPNVIIIHLVRDGRDVVRSIIAKEHYLDGAKGHYNIIPDAEDSLLEEWDGLSRFEKICWLWTDSNRRIHEFADKTVMFEKLIHDYAYFKQNVVDYLGIDISEQCWSEEVYRPKNRTKKHVMPHWTEWDDETTEQFWRICKNEMYKYGYV